MSAPSSTSSFASAIECRAVTGGDAATELLASTRRAPTWPRRRRLALVGTRQAPHPSKHVCSAFRRLFRATQKAILQAVESGAQAAGNRDFPVALTPPVMDPAVQQVSGLMDWGGVPLHVTVVDAAVAPRGSGFPIEPSHIVGVSGILYCFSPFDRDSFAAMQALQQSIVATLAPIPCVVVAVVEESPKTTAAASDAATAQQLAAMQAAAGQKMKIKVGTKGAAQDPRVAPEPRPLERVVTPEEVEHLCREWGCRAFELSTAAVQPDLLANMVDQALRHQMSRSRQRSESPAQQRHVDPTVVVNGTHHQADKPPLATASSSTTSQPKSVDACSTPQQPPQPKTAEADSVAHALPPHQVHPQPPAQPNGANGVTQRNASNPSATGGVAASRRNHQGHCLVA